MFFLLYQCQIWTESVYLIVREVICAMPVPLLVSYCAQCMKQRISRDHFREKPLSRLASTSLRFS